MLEHLSKVKDERVVSSKEGITPASASFVNPMKDLAVVGDRNVLNDALTRHEEQIAK